MKKADLLLVLPSNIDFPLFRYYIKKIRNLFKKIIIVDTGPIDIHEGFNIFPHIQKTSLKN